MAPNGTFYRVQSHGRQAKMRLLSHQPDSLDQKYENALVATKSWHPRSGKEEQTAAGRVQELLNLQRSSKGTMLSIQNPCRRQGINKQKEIQQFFSSFRCNRPQPKDPSVEEGDEHYSKSGLVAGSIDQNHPGADEITETPTLKSLSRRRVYHGKEEDREGL